MNKNQNALATSIVYFLLASMLFAPAAANDQTTVSLGNPTSRPDRLVTISGRRQADLLAEYSTDGKKWLPATIYLGASIDQRRASMISDWNRSVKTGRIPAGSTPCVWNYFFDITQTGGKVQLRLKSSADPAKIVLQKNVDLSITKDVVVIDATNIKKMCGEKLPESWNLAPAGVKSSNFNSIHCKIDNAVKKHPTTLVLKPKLKGWYRVYLGMEPYSTCRIWLSGVNARYEVPNYYNKSTQKIENRLLRESKITEADMTGQDICISPGGARAWYDVSIRYVRLVPMSEKEIATHRELRRVARERGRPFAGYVEQVTPCAYEPESLTLAEHTRNEMKLNQVRGSTDVYVHVIRIGSKAWYHSDIIEWYTGKDSKWPKWMQSGDPLAVAVEEARRHKLKIFADAGMNACYFNKSGKSKGMPDKWVAQHPQVVYPEYNHHCMDYRKKIVRDYVLSVIAELLNKYDLDGVNLDFGRWGFRKAYDTESLVEVLRRIDKHRKAAKKKWGHPVLISARVDFDPPPAKGRPEPTFLAAVRAWAKAGLVDRIMVNFDGKLAPDVPIKHYLDATKGTKTELWGDLYWGTWHKGGGPAKDIAIARAWVEQGLDGGFFYYMRARPSDFEGVNWQLRAIDHPELILTDHE